MASKLAKKKRINNTRSMKVTGFSYALESIQAELSDATRMYRKIAEDPRRKLDQPNEKLHYWDGKMTGLQLALEYLRKVKKDV